MQYKVNREPIVAFSIYEMHDQTMQIIKLSLIKYNLIHIE